MKQFFYNLPIWLRNNRKWVFSFYAVFFIFCFFGVGKNWRDDSIESWLGDDALVIKNQRQFERYFGSSEDLYLVVEAKDGDVFSEKSLAALHKLNDKLESFSAEIQRNPESPLHHISEVISLINVSVNDVEGDSLFTRPFIGNNLPHNDTERAALKKRALSDPDLIKRFVSKNGRYAAISIKTDFGSLTSKDKKAPVNEDSFMSLSSGDLAAPTKKETVSLKTPPRNYEEYGSFMAEMRRFVDSAQTSESLSVYYAGLPELVAFFLHIEEENGVIFSGLFVLMLVTLAILFRHLSAVVWCLAIIILTLIFSLGLHGWSTLPTSDLTAAMVLMLIIISVADAVHIISGYKYERLEGLSHEESLSEAMSKAGMSCLMTLITTMIAFASLFVVQPNIPSAIFGLFTSLGLVFAFVLSVTLLPLLLDIWRPSYKKAEAVEKQSAHETEAHYPVMDFISGIVTRHPRLVMAVMVAILVPIMAGMKYIKVDANPLESFSKSTFIRQAFDIADENMGGTQNIDFMIELGKVDAVYDAAVLKTIDQLQQRMVNEFPDFISTSVSIVNVLKRINQQLHQDNPAYYRLPDSDGEIRQLLFLFNNASPDERRRLVSEDFDATRISFGLKNAGSTEYVTLVDNAQLWGNEYFNKLHSTYPDLKVATAGGVIMFMTLFDNISRSELLCFVITLGVVLVVLFFVFRSVKMGILAVIPNLVPVAITFGVMGWLGITLNNVTMILAPIILGIAVDDTVHFLYKLKLLLPETKDVDEAIKITFREVGTAITSTTLILSAGMLILLYSSNSDFQAFGYLSAIAFFGGLISEFTITPILCRWFLSAKKSNQSEFNQFSAEGKIHENPIA